MPFVFQCQKYARVDYVLSSGIVSYEDSDDTPGLTAVFAGCYYNKTIEIDTYT